MANISDVIEQFILDALGQEASIIISRNQLAGHFDCSPSQINYVLSTRFTADRGFLTGSKRGGGGYIEVIRIESGAEPYLSSLIAEGIGGEITRQRASHIAERLLAEEIIDEKEFNIMTAALSDESLSTPFPIKDKLRAQVLKNIIITLLKE